ncbi:hypothetical protein [Tianweitania sediminis]|uniref:Uncharacterized protein n=1 Tax=Tianweitania sediminis TaxID=1502156 RepID=A0A8J7R0D4_9HYPH|nr:hypothetical protein [Tianweitania sediminis]MBP0439550.1 hypothetical protein [Tianweitania sediminis]
MAANNIERFNTIVGLVFEQLYRAFPVPITIDEPAIAKAMGLTVELKYHDDDPRFPPVAQIGNFDDGSSFNGMLWAALPWLVDEGYIRAQGQVRSEEAVLTSKALSILNAAPESLGGTLGAKLTGLAKEAGSEAGRAVINGVVGQIFSFGLRILS